MSDPLLELARLYGVETEYEDVDGARQRASEEALAGTLAALDALVDGDAAESLAARRQELAEQLVEPVVVAWNGAGSAPLRLLGGEAVVHVRFEEGGEKEWRVAARDLSAAAAGPEGTPRLALPLAGLPPVTTG